MSLGDNEHPISFRFEPELRGGHVHLTVRAGLAGSRGLLGTLVMRHEEYAVLRFALATAPFTPLIEVALPQAPSDLRPGRYFKEISMEPFEFGEPSFAATDSGEVS